jgi:hypothetical protein
MDYDSQEESKTTMAGEAALAYDIPVKTISEAEIESECMPLEKSKRLLLVHVHDAVHSLLYH